MNKLQCKKHNKSLSPQGQLKKYAWYWFVLALESG